MSNGWDASAGAWIAEMGEQGDWGRRHVLDAPMLERVRGGGFERAIDIGCGEGRFCRMLRGSGVQAVGVDPTVELIARARRLDPDGDYRIAGGEALPVDDACVDLVVFYLSLIDIPDFRAALREARRVLQPGGILLIANLQSFNTAAVPQGWTREPDGSRRFCIDRYMEERQVELGWRGIHITNHHRPMSAYIGTLLELGFVLRRFEEPLPVGADGDKAERYRRVPNFLVMEWQLP